VVVAAEFAAAIIVVSVVPTTITTKETPIVVRTRARTNTRMIHFASHVFSISNSILRPVNGDASATNSLPVLLLLPCSSDDEEDAAAAP